MRDLEAVSIPYLAGLLFRPFLRPLKLPMACHLRHPEALFLPLSCRFLPSHCHLPLLRAPR